MQYRAHTDPNVINIHARPPTRSHTHRTARYLHSHTQARTRPRQARPTATRPHLHPARHIMHPRPVSPRATQPARSDVMHHDKARTMRATARACPPTPRTAHDTRRCALTATTYTSRFERSPARHTTPFAPLRRDGDAQTPRQSTLPATRNAQKRYHPHAHAHTHEMQTSKI